MAETPMVLLTGATGFIGGAALALLFRRHPEYRTKLIVRARSDNEAAERVLKSLLRFGPRGDFEAGLANCWVIAADLTDTASLATRSLDDVTHALHLASNTSFRSVRGVRHANILGTLALAHRLRRVDSLRRFLHVGTAYICGEDSHRTVREDDFPRPGVAHIVEYTSSKAECELLLRATAPELPLVIARPSVVVGHTELGCGPSSSIFWFYRTVDALRRTTFPLESYDDVVPADYVAEALLYLLFQPQLRESCYHISSGEIASVTWHEIAEVFTRAYGARLDNPYREVDFAQIVAERSRMKSFLGPGNEERMLMALQIYYRFAEIPAEMFDNRRLLAEGFQAPPKFTSYLERCTQIPAGRSVYDQMLDDD